MKYQERTYFAFDGDDDSTKGMAILEADEEYGDYSVAEHTDDGWVVPFWLPEPDLDGMVENGILTEKGQLSDSQFEQVEEKALAVA